MNRDEAIQATLEVLNQPMDYSSRPMEYPSRPSFHSRRSSIMAQLSTPTHYSHGRTPSVSMSDSDMSCMDEHKRRSRISIDFSGLYSPASSASDWGEKELLSPDPEIETLDKKRSSQSSDSLKRWSLGPATSVAQVSRQTHALFQEFNTDYETTQSCTWQRTLQEMARTDNTRLALLSRNTNVNTYPMQSMHSKNRHSCDLTGLGLGFTPVRASTPVKPGSAGAATGSSSSFVPFTFETGHEDIELCPKTRHRASVSRARPMSMTRSTTHKFNSTNFSLRQRTEDPDTYSIGNDSTDSNNTVVDPLDTGKDDLKKEEIPTVTPTIPITDWSQKTQIIKLICAPIQDAPTMLAYLGLLWTALSNPENLNLDKIDVLPSSLEDVALVQENIIRLAADVDVKAMLMAGWIRFYRVLCSSAVVGATLCLLAFQALLLLLYFSVATAIILVSSILHQFDRTEKTDKKE